MIYLDQASSAFPKAPPVPGAVEEFLRTGAQSVARGSYALTYDGSQLVRKTRETIGHTFGAADRGVVFTANVTMSLNLLIQGLFRPGDHVITSGLEHNAVTRPLARLQKRGVAWTAVSCAPDGETDPDAFRRALRPQTRAILVTAASNVCGTRLPLAEIGQIAQEAGVRYCIDGAQLAGFAPIDMEALGCDALALTGHKSLLGPQGIGALILPEEMAREMEPLLLGGTGKASEEEDMPSTLPERLEAGTQNLAGIAGLAASLRWLEGHGEEAVKTEMHLVRRLIDGLAELPCPLVGKALADADVRTPTVAIDTHPLSPEMVSELLAERDIVTRAGLHCAPLAHRSLGTFPRGLLRVSVGYANTAAEVDAFLEALGEICAASDA